MRITRKTNILIKTERRFVVKSPTTDEPIICEQCCEPMISAQLSADFFGFSNRVIYRLIETEDIHFVESENNVVYVCPVSIKQILEI